MAVDQQAGCLPKESKKACTESSKLRIPSLSTLFGTNMQDQHEVFGFRRFAKAYILGTETPYSSNNTKLDFTSHSRKQNCGKDASSYYTCANENTASRPPPRSTINSYSESQLGLFLKHKFVAETERLNVSGEMTNYDTNKKKSMERKDLTPFTLCLSNRFTHNSTDVVDFNKEATKVVLGNIPYGTGLKSIINQVHGGPLKELRFVESGIPGINFDKVELNFMTKEDAQAFIKYAESQLFKVNGRHFETIWAPPGSMEDDSHEDYMLDDGMETHFGSPCRSLILKRYPKRSKFKRTGSKQDLVLEHFDIKQLKEDFGEFGDIMEITPIVSRKLSVSVYFYDVISAMKAIYSYQDKNSAFHKKYYRSWAMWYGRDVTDKPCIEF